MSERNAERESVPCVKLRGAYPNTTDTSSRATRASSNRRGDRARANPRSAPGTTATRALLRRRFAGTRHHLRHPRSKRPPQRSSISATSPIRAPATVACDLTRHRRRRPSQPGRAYLSGGTAARPSRHIARPGPASAAVMRSTCQIPAASRTASIRVMLATAPSPCTGSAGPPAIASENARSWYQ